MAVFSGNGAVGSPSFTFSSDTDTGIYRDDADALGVTAGGSALTIFRSTRVDVRNSENFPADIPTTNTLFRAVRTNSSANSNSRAYADQRPAVVAGINAALSTNNEGVHSALQTTSFIGLVTTPPAHIRSYSFSGASGATRNLKYEVDGGGNVNLFDGAGIRFNSSQTIDGSFFNDYEEGTWTPQSTAGGLTNSSGRYVKIGRFVWANFRFEVNSTTSSIIRLLPVPVNTSTGGDVRGVISYSDAMVDANAPYQLTAGSETYIDIVKNDGGAVSHNQLNGNIFEGHLMYVTFA